MLGAGLMVPVVYVRGLVMQSGGQHVLLCHLHFVLVGLGVVIAHPLAVHFNAVVMLHDVVQLSVQLTHGVVYVAIAISSSILLVSHAFGFGVPSHVQEKNPVGVITSFVDGAWVDSNVELLEMTSNVDNSPNRSVVATPCSIPARVTWRWYFPGGASVGIINDSA